MFYKLSNTTNLQDIEAAFDADFKFPLLYSETPLINGLCEETLSIITMDRPKVIDFAIWGLLPQNYGDGWENFQSHTNTLNISIDELQKIDWISKILNKQRCVIIVSGFFTSYLYKGEVYPFYVYEKNHNPIALAGVYTELNDGFLSVSLITSALQNDLIEVHNLGKDFPIAMSADHFSDWLNKDDDFINNGINSINRLELKAHTISKEFYKNDIVFESLLEPAHYDNLPILSLK